MAEQLLDRPDVVAVIEKMRRERMPQRVTARVLVDPRFRTASLTARWTADSSR